MNALKIALLGTATLAAVSVSARADDLADLKAQIEALNGRITQMESAPAVPAGYQLLSVSEANAIIVPSLDVDKSYGTTANNIGILPTADVPAATNIQWSGFVRAGIRYKKDKWSASVPAMVTAPTNVVPLTNNDLDVTGRAELKVVGTTDTAVGEVGVLIKLRGDALDSATVGVTMPEAWGWWKMTPELTLGAGYTGTLSNIGYGYDGACSCYLTDNAPVGLNPGDTTQMRLSYASGPLSFAIAIEDATTTVVVAQPYLTAVNGAAGHSVVAGPKDLGAAGEIKYVGDMFSAEVSAGWWDTSGTALAVAPAPAAGPFGPGANYVAGDTTTDSYQVGAGVGFSFDPINVSMGAAMGQLATGSDYWKASILASASLSDAVSLELAYGHTDFDSANAASGRFTAYNSKVDAFLAGIYYTPVSQLTIGLEGEMWKQKWSGLSAASATAGGVNSVTQKSMSANIITVYRF